MIWDRERYVSHCTFDFTGREMFCELFGPLVGLEEEWRKQGATAKEIALTAFDWDYVLKTELPIDCFARTGITPVTLQDDSEVTLGIDHMGRHTKLCKKSATIPLPLEYPVQTMDDWLKIKHWYEFSEDRIDVEGLKRAKALRDKGYLTLTAMPGGFDEPRQLMGEENLCIACYEEPELIHDMLNTMADTCVKVLERVGEYVTLDQLGVHEDMAGKSGPLFGPDQVREFMKPYYLKVWDCARAQGARLFSQDSDGNTTADIEAFLESGINCMHPFEPASGLDPVKIRQEHGRRFLIKGGIDKFALLRGKEAIRKELEYKMTGPLRGGGTVFAIDHRIPNGVTLENYKYYVNLGREMLDLPPISGEGWERMAF